MIDYYGLECEAKPKKRPGLIAALGIGLGLALGFVNGALSYKHEKEREKCIPLGFSEIHQIEKDKDVTYTFRVENPDGKYGGEGLGSRTYYYAGLNDLVMKTFECWNQANNPAEATPDTISQGFGKNLGDRFNAEKKQHHYEFTELYPLVAESRDELVQNLGNLANARTKVQATKSLLDASWREEHHDNYHTTVTASKRGATTHRVYDNTDHKFIYSFSIGKKAADSFDEVSKMPNVRLNDMVYTATKTNEDGEKAAVETRTKGDKKPELSKKSLKEIANNWHNGSTLSVNEGEIYSSWTGISSLSPKLRSASLRAKPEYNFRTGSRNHPGPDEYQTFIECSNTCETFYRASSEVLGSLDKSKGLITELREKSHALAKKANKGEECEKDAEEVMKLAREVYKTNFKGGFNVPEFRTWLIGLLGFSGLVAGAAAGIGLGGLFKRRD